MSSVDKFGSPLSYFVIHSRFLFPFFKASQGFCLCAVLHNMCSFEKFVQFGRKSRAILKYLVYRVENKSYWKEEFKQKNTKKSFQSVIPIVSCNSIENNPIYNQDLILISI